MSRNKRRIYLINPKFQLRVIGFSVFVALIIVGIFYGANQYFFWNFTQHGIALGLPSDHVYFQFLNEQSKMMDIIFGATALLAFAVLSLAGLIMSHRVAGPMYRLHRHMSDIAEGKTVGDVKFRDKDYFQEVAAAFNLQLARFRNHPSVEKTERETDRETG